MTFCFSKLRSLRVSEGMPPTVVKAHQWQLCDACGRKPLELVEIAVCLLLWYSYMPTRPRVPTRMAPAQECWMREGGIFNHLAALEPRHFSQLVALMAPSLSQIHYRPSLFFSSKSTRKVYHGARAG